MKGKELLLIAISSFILTVIWIVSNVYHAYATSTLDSLLQMQITPISSDFDQATINALKARTVVSQLSSVTPQETPTPTIVPESTGTIIPTPIQSEPTPSEVILPSDTPTPSISQDTPTPTIQNPSPTP